jgi:hypothetical protein
MKHDEGLFSICTPIEVMDTEAVHGNEPVHWLLRLKGKRTGTQEAQEAQEKPLLVPLVLLVFLSCLHNVLPWFAQS